MIIPSKEACTYTPNSVAYRALVTTLLLASFIRIGCGIAGVGRSPCSMLVEAQHAVLFGVSLLPMVFTLLFLLVNCIGDRICWVRRDSLRLFCGSRQRYRLFVLDSVTKVRLQVEKGSTSQPFNFLTFWFLATLVQLTTGHVWGTADFRQGRECLMVDKGCYFLPVLDFGLWVVVVCGIAV